MSVLANQPPVLARIGYPVETDDDRTWYDFAVYTEEAVTEHRERCAREYGESSVTRYSPYAITYYRWDWRSQRVVEQEIS